MSGRWVSSVCTAALAVVLLPPPGPVHADASVTDMLARLQTLYVQAEEATERYNATEEKLERQADRTRALHRELAEARTSLTDHRNAAGGLARQQYRNSAAGLPAVVRALLAGDPRRITDQQHRWRRVAAYQALTLTRLARSEKRADALATRARKALDRRSTLAAQRKKQRATVTKRLARVQEALASLSDGELAALRLVEQQDTASAQRALRDSGVLADPQRAPSAEGNRALRYAVRQVGKPYRWGAEGPDSFDCSGLASQAWARAGRPIPRTSQQQWRRLPRVPLHRLRPGDLVVYSPRASHVALYAGAGLVVHAPRPGSRVKVTPLAVGPLLGAVRPDAGRPALRMFSPPRAPRG